MGDVDKWTRCVTRSRLFGIDSLLSHLQLERVNIIKLRLFSSRFKDWCIHGSCNSILLIHSGFQLWYFNDAGCASRKMCFFGALHNWVAYKPIYMNLCRINNSWQGYQGKSLFTGHFDYIRLEQIVFDKEILCNPPVLIDVHLHHLVVEIMIHRCDIEHIFLQQLLGCRTLYHTASFLICFKVGAFEYQEKTH